MRSSKQNLNISLLLHMLQYCEDNDVEISRLHFILKMNTLKYSQNIWPKIDI